MITLVEYPECSVAEDGVIWSTLGEKVFGTLKPRMNNRGYLRVLVKNATGQYKEMLVHRLVALAFIPNPDDLPEVNHIDLDPTNNDVRNLEWVTHAQNMAHSKMVHAQR